jgi:hypothetical protein
VLRVWEQEQIGKQEYAHSDEKKGFTHQAGLISMNVFTLYLRVAKKKIPVRIKPAGGELVLVFTYFKPLLDEIKSMEGAKWHGDAKCWSISNSERNLFALDLLSNGKRIKPYDAELKNVLPSLEEKGFDFSTFWQHQKEDINFIFTRHRCIIAGEPRTGKTRPTLACVMACDFDYAWWVAPKSALRGLHSELRKWKFNKRMSLLTYEGFKTEASRTLSESGISLPGFIVFDECHKLKTPTSQQTKTAIEMTQGLEDIYGGREFVVGLSGTPAPKDPSDWWSICEVVRPGFIKESSKQKLARRLGDFEEVSDISVGQRYWRLNKTIQNPTGWKEDEIFKLYKRLRPLVVVHLKKDCLDLPEVRYELATITPSRATLRVARLITNTETSVLQVINKLRQLSDGFQYDTEYNEAANRDRRVFRYIGSPKEDRLRDDLSAHEEGGRLVVYTGFQGSVDIIVRVCRECGWFVLQADGRGWKVFGPTEANDSELQKSYSPDFALTEMDRSQNTGTIKKLVFVAQTDAAGTGLELSASPTIIFYSNSNNGAGRMQAVERPYSNNMDKERGLTVIDYCHLPVDLAIREAHMTKKDLQHISMGELKQLLNDDSDLESLIERSSSG